MVAIRGHFDGKVFVPDEPVNLPSGQEVILHVQPELKRPNAEPAEHFLDWVAANLVAKADLPADGSQQHDHYLYGTPKRDAER